MISIPIRTAGRTATVLLLAVFFSTGAMAADSSLFNLEQGFTELIYGLSRSVVKVEAARRVTNQLYGVTGEEAVQHQVSSGLIFDSVGHILVAAPLVINQDRIAVNFDNRIIPARLVGVDYHTGLALLATGLRLGRPTRLSNQQSCAGQMVVSLGTAYGVRASPSIGFCAGVGVDGNLQFAVPASAGSMGGGVFSLSGELLGVIIGRVGEDNQVLQAVPAYRIAAIVDYLLTNGDRPAGFMGVTTAEIEVSPGIEIQTPSSAMLASTGKRRVIERGVVITDVVPMSAADRAGLRVGDLIFSFNDRGISSAFELARQVIQTRPGTTVRMELLRRNTYFDVQLQIGRKTFDSVPVEGVSLARGRSDAALADSIVQALSDLKRQIRSLENRLTDLRY